MIKQRFLHHSFKGVDKMEKVIEVLRIKQEIRELPTEYQQYAQYTIRSPYDAIDLVTAMIADEDREVFLVLTLNTKNQITAVHRCHVGALSSSMVTPREVFKSAILNNGASIIVAHNHPSGNPEQSKEDIEVSRRLVESGKILGIPVLDSLIVGLNSGISLKEKGYI